MNSKGEEIINHFIIPTNAHNVKT